MSCIMDSVVFVKEHQGDFRKTTRNIIALLQKLQSALRLAVKFSIYYEL